MLLLDITAVDFLPRTPRYEVIYLLRRPGASGFGTTPKRLRMKVRVAADEHLPTVSGVWPAANWAERELYDMFGIVVRRPSGSAADPDARGLGRAPGAADYPVQIKMTVKTYEPLQLSQEEFVANVESARNRSQSRVTAPA